VIKEIKALKLSEDSELLFDAGSLLVEKYKDDFTSKSP